MLQFFNNNHLGTSVLVCLYAWVLLLPPWFIEGLAKQNFFEPSQGSLLAAWLWGGLLAEVWLQKLILAVLLPAQALFINALVNYFRVAKRYTYYPALAYLLFWFILPSSGGTALSPAFVAGFLSTVSVWWLWTSAEAKGQVGQVFNSGFFLGLGALLFPPMLLLSPVWFWGIVRLRGFDWREGLIFLSGILVPLFWAFTYHYYQGELAAYGAQDWWGSAWRLGLVWPKFWQAWAILALVPLTALVTLLNIQNLRSKLSLKEQKHVVFSLVWALSLPLLVWLRGPGEWADFQVLLPGAGLLLGLLLLQAKTQVRAELWHFAFLLLAIVSAYGLI